MVEDRIAVEADIYDRPVQIPIAGGALEGRLTVPKGARGLVIFAHGSGSSRFSPRNWYVAEVLHGQKLGSLLVDLLTPDEERVDLHTREFRFDIPLLARRLAAVTQFAATAEETAALRIGYFGSSTGAGAALIAAAEGRGQIHAVVSRGGRPDLAMDYLPLVAAPTLLIVGGYDREVIALNEQALAHLNPKSKMHIVPGATHLFEEPGTLEKVAHVAADWFKAYLE